MSPRRTTPWPAGSPAWADVTTPDLDAAQAFYGPLLGWTFGDRDPQFGGYCMCLRDGVPAAGMAPAMEGSPPAWTVYFAVDDAQATADAIAASGGRLLSDVMRIGDAGTMAVAADPAGGVFGVWQAQLMNGFAVAGESGAFFWTDMRSTDHAASRAFFGSVLGWDFAPVPMAGPEYTTVHHVGDPTPLGGLGSMMGNPGTSHWITYFGVDDVDAAVELVAASGGTVVSTGFETPYGRMAAVTDPFGASFWIMMPTADQPAGGSG